MDTLNFDKAKRRVGSNQTPREYYDFIISGQSLRKILNIENADFISPFGWGANKDYNRHLLNVFRLKEKSELTSGRIMLYVCPECGDIDCGAITVKIKDFGDRIIWSDFGFETNYGGQSESYDQIEPIEFNRSDYFSAFLKIPV